MNNDDTVSFFDEPLTMDGVVSGGEEGGGGGGGLE